MACMQNSVSQRNDKARGTTDNDDNIPPRPLGGRLPGQIARLFSEEEDLCLMYYLAHRAPSTTIRDWNYDKKKPYVYDNHHGRGGNVFYKQLVASERKWARTHSWMAWRNRYMKAAEWFDEQIADYIKQNPGVKKNYVERRMYDFEDEPGMEEGMDTERQETGYNASQELRNATPGPSQPRTSINDSGQLSEADGRGSARAASNQPHRSRAAHRPTPEQEEQEEEREGDELDRPKDHVYSVPKGSRSHAAISSRKPVLAIDEDDDLLEEESTDDEILARRTKRIGQKRATSSVKAPFATHFGIIPDEDLEHGHSKGDGPVILAKKLIALIEQRRLHALRAVSNQHRKPPHAPLPPPESHDRRHQRAPPENAIDAANDESLDIESTAVDRTTSGFGSSFGTRSKPSQTESLINFFHEQGPSRGSRSRGVGQPLSPDVVHLSASEIALREGEDFEMEADDDAQAGRLLDAKQHADEALEAARKASIRAGKKRRRDDAFDNDTDELHDGSMAADVPLGTREAVVEVEETVADSPGAPKLNRHSSSITHMDAMKTTTDASKSALGRVAKTAKKKNKKNKKNKKGLSNNPADVFRGATRMSEDDVQRRKSLSSQAGAHPDPQASLSGSSPAASKAYAYVPEIDFTAKSPYKVVNKVLRNSLTGARVDSASAIAVMQDNDYRPSPLRSSIAATRPSMEASPSKRRKEAEALPEPPRKRHRATRSVQELSEEPIRPFTRRTTREPSDEDQARHLATNPPPPVTASRDQSRRRLQSQTPAAGTAKARAPAR